MTVTRKTRHTAEEEKNEVITKCTTVMLRRKEI